MELLHIALVEPPWSLNMATKTRLTLEEFLELPETETRYELVNGELVEMPPHSSRIHGSVIGTIAYRLGDYVRKRGAGHVVVQDPFVLPLPEDPERVRIPDVAFISVERGGGGAVPSWFEGAPDLAVEVLSPSEKSQETQGKVQEYLATGARLVWVIAPEARSATVYRADGSARLVRAGEALQGDELLPELAIPLSELLP
jgi:Uma2 family endonuclease